MRPLTLKVAGLRSYRREQSIDFSEAGLMAIVGDTGAGKSSLLDGIFFALYGGCTWDRRAVVPLISDGENAMQVELEFLAEGRRWRVFRSASRTGTATRAELVCLDDPNDRYDNSEPVTAKIRQLVGLDDDAFLRTVILPQGRFQALLQATRGDRTAILKGIFRLEQLEAVRTAADQAARRMRPGVSQLREERAALLPDPAAALADAEQRQDDARRRQGRLKALAEQIATLDQTQGQLRRQAIDLGRLAGRLGDEHQSSVADQLEELAERAETVDGQLADVDAQLAAQRKRTDELEGFLRDAEAAGAGVAALASAATTLKSLVGQLPGLLNERGACTEEGEELARLRAAATTEEARVAELEAGLEAAQGLTESRRAAARQAAAALGDARAALVQARQAHQKADDEAATADGADAALAPARAKVEAAQGALRDALAARSRAEEALAAVQRAHAAAHAAEGSHPGDPCPVCRRALPDDFTLPEAPGDRAARDALAAAETAVETARSAVDTAKGDAARADEAARQARLRREAAGTAASTTLASLHALVPAASLSDSDEALLAGLVTAANGTEAEASRAAADQATLQQQAAAARTALEAAHRELARRVKDLDARERSVSERFGAAEQSAQAVPAAYRPAVPLDGADLHAVAHRVEARRGELAAVEQELETLRARARALELQHTTLSGQRRREVEEPAGQIDRRLGALAHHLGDLVEALGAGSVPARPDGDLAELVGWARALSAAVGDATTAAQARIAEAEARAGQLDEELRLALEAEGFSGREEVGEAQIAVAAALSRAEEDAATARDHQPRAATLEAAIGRAAGLLDALDELTKLLTDGRFIGAVVAHKQKTLLAVASEILGAMTGNRYGFSEDFEIVDRLTGLPRGVKTLSGGETFLASLALALGLVELAGRGGGRLDALFLDEGFGSLDANSLAEALDALGRQAEGGRLVVVISHLRAVAEAMEHLVAVTRSPDGSRIRPLSGSDRDQMVEEEIEAGLLT